MKIFLYLLSIFFLLIGMYAVISNWYILWIYYVKKQHVGSSVPLIAGVLVMIGLILYPHNDIKKLCWIGLLIDPVSIPGILYTVWQIHKSKGSDGTKEDSMSLEAKEQYKEIWVYSKEDEQAMGALTNGDFGWLMYLREEGDAGFSSRNPDYTGSDDDGKTMEFLLSNGQLDEYPLSFVLPLEQVIRALDYFEKYNRPPDFIVWHNDSGDGASLNE